MYLFEQPSYRDYVLILSIPVRMFHTVNDPKRLSLPTQPNWRFSRRAVVSRVPSRTEIASHIEV